MNRYIRLPKAEKITTETIEGPINRYTSGDIFSLNTEMILRVWHEIYPNNYAADDDHSVVLVEDIRGNIYVAKETNDCMISDSHVNLFLSNLRK